MWGAPEHVQSTLLLQQGVPQQDVNKIDGPAADMWSVGVVAYNLVSGFLLINLSTWLS